MTDSEIPFSEMTIEQQIEVICQKWNKTPGELLPSDIRRFSEALLMAEKGGKPTPRRPAAPMRSVTPVPATLDGMKVDSDQFKALPPRERIRKFREAEARAKHEAEKKSGVKTPV